MSEVIPNQVWKHKSGSFYRVLLITNEQSTREEYPITVVYKGQDGVVWSRPLSKWHDSMTLERDSIKIS